MKINEAEILFFGQRVIVACDRNCQKAWGINNRPRIQLDEDNWDNYVYLSDTELGEAPANPGTYEGNDAKPLSPDDFPNKWCVRECERSTMVDKGKLYTLRDFSQRLYNIAPIQE